MFNVLDNVSIAYGMYAIKDKDKDLSYLQYSSC